MHLKKTGKFKVYHLAFLSPITWLTLASTPGFAQNITASDDGTGTQISQQGDEFQISGGTENGGNQFHSFEQFGLEEQQTATFQTNPDTANVLGRVTGGDPSVINGTVRVTGSEANLYLMNPAGMVFGENARLDVPGSFHGTTADAIEFEEGEFSATGNNAYENLAGAPNRFQFEGGSTGAIVNQGDLAVGSGKNLSLTGSTVINTGTLTAPGGQVAVVAAPTAQGSQSVRITQNGMVMGLEVAGDRLSEANLSPQDLIQNPTHLPKVLTGGYVDHATDLQVVDGRVYLRGSALAIDPLTGAAVVSGVVNVSSPDPLTQGGAVLVQGDRVQVLDAQMAAQGHGGQIHLQSHQATQVLSSQLTLGNLVGIGGLLKIQGASVGVEDTTIAAPGLQRGGLIQIHALEGLAHLGNSSITAIARQGTGGRVEVLGDRVAVVATAIDASGVAGGKLYIGGDYQGGGTLATAQEVFVDGGSVLKAEGLGWHSTDPSPPPPDLPQALGGQVIVWADNRTRFYGVLKAKGAAEFSDSGFAEISGKVALDLGEQWDQRIQVGELLLDPTDIAITPGTGTYGTTTLANYLQNTGNLILTTASAGADTGDITVSGTISWSSGSVLTLRADRSINFSANATLQATGSGSLILEANQGTTPITGAFNAIDLRSGNVLLATNSGDITLTGTGGTIGSGFSSGIYLLGGSTIQTTSGNISLTGRGQSAGFNNLGMRIEGAGTKITAHSGSITLNGTGADGNRAQHGIVIWSDSQITSTGTATITLNGTGGNTSGQGFQQGVRVFRGAIVSTVDGDITFNGVGGNDATGSNLPGIYLNATVESTGAGKIIFNGTGGLNAGQGYGIWVDTLGSISSTGSGLITLNGTGGTGSGGDGIVVQGSVSATGTGTVTLEGREAVQGLQGIRLTGGRLGAVASVSNLDLKADTIALNGQVLGQGLLTIAPLTPSTSIGLGDSVPGTLNLTAAELNNIAPTFTRIGIGRGDGTGSVRIGQGIDPGVASLITLLGGSDLGAGNDPGNQWELTGLNSGIINGVNFQNFTTLLGGSLDDRLQGTIGADQFQITGANQIVVGSMTFTGIEDLNGGDGDDGFTLVGGTLSGAIQGGTGNNALTVDSGAVAFGITGLDSGTVAGIGGGFSQIQNLTGGSGNDTFTLLGGTLTGTIAGGGGTNSLTGGSIASNFGITGLDSGTATGMGGGFSQIQNLAGGSANDTFTLLGGTLSGTIAGGGGTNSLTGGSIASNFGITGLDSGTATGIGGGFSQIQNLTGGSANDTFTLGGGTLSGTIAGGGGSNTLMGNNLANTFGITGLNSGTVAGIAGGFSQIQNLTGGSANDTFTLAGGTLSGTIAGGGGTNTLTGDNLANTFGITGLDSGTATGIAGGFSQIQNLIGGSANDTFTLLGGTLSGTIAGGGGTNALTGGSIASNFGITGLDSGTATGIAGGFSQIQNLTGGSANDTFTLLGGTLTGTIDGGGGSNTLIGDNLANTFGITGTDQGTLNGLGNGFSQVGSLIGGSSTDVFQWIAGNLSGSIDGGGGTNRLILPNQATTIAIIGPNSGTITGLGQGFQNLTDITANAQADTFQFGTAGSLAGTIDGGLGSDLLIADDGGALIDISGTDAGTYAGKVAGWRNLENILGGSGADTFLLSANTLTGTLDGGGGLDTMVGDTVPNRFVVLTANGGTVTGVLGGFRSIENLTGNRFNDTFLIASTGSLAGLIDGAEGIDTLQSGDQGVLFTITGVDAGVLENFTGGFVRIENLTGGTGDDRFVLAGGSLNGLMDGGPGTDFLLGGDSANVRLETPLLFAQLFGPVEAEAPIGSYDIMPSAGDPRVVEVSAMNQTKLLDTTPPDLGLGTNAPAVNDPIIPFDDPARATNPDGANPNPGSSGGGAGTGTGAGAGAGNGAGTGAGAANVAPPELLGNAPGSGGSAIANLVSPEAASNAVLPDPTAATSSQSKLPQANAAANSGGSADRPEATIARGLGGEAASATETETQGGNPTLAIVVAAALAALGGAAALATGAASTAAQSAQTLAQTLKNLLSGAPSPPGGATPGIPLATALLGASQAQQYLAQLKVALEPRIESQLKVSLNKSEGANLTTGAMALEDQALWNGADLATAPTDLPGLGELMGLNTGGPAIAAEDPDSKPARNPADPGMQQKLEAKVAAVKAKIAAAAAKAGIPEEAVDALYAVAIERIGEILSSIDLAEGILGTAWSKALEIMEYRALVEHIQAQGTLMIPLVTHEILAEQTPSIELKFQETPVGNFEINLSLGVIVHGATLALEGGKLTHIHLGRISLTGGIEFAGLSLFEAPDAELEINRIIPLGDGITIPLPT